MSNSLVGKPGKGHDKPQKKNPKKHLQRRSIARFDYQENAKTQYLLLSTAQNRRGRGSLRRGTTEEYRGGAKKRNREWLVRKREKQQQREED